MNNNNNNFFSNLASFKNYKARSITSITGPSAFGDRLSKTNPNLDRLTFVKPRETVVLAEMEGPGEIVHFWCTIYSDDPYWPRKVMLRMYWDGEDNPSVECPIGDFFGLGHGMQYSYVSMPFVIGSHNGFNCYWPMPYMKSARIEITNEGDDDIHCFYYIIDFREYNTPPKNVGLFHAKYRQEMPTMLGKNYTVFEAKGKGHFVGLNMSIELYQDKWWGAGDAMIWVDGETEFSVAGTAGEDYFGGGWSYPETFDAPFIGHPLQNLKAPHKKGSRWNVYRYLIPDPVPFEESIRMEFEVIEDQSSRPELIYRQDHYSSVAYWYQSEPHIEFFTMPSAKERLPRGQEPTGE
jgi:hypothetical protein